MVITKTANHPKPSKTTRNHPKPPETIQNHPKPPKISCSQPQTTRISYNQPQTTRNNQQPATKCIWLILSSKILKLYSTIFPKLLKNNEYFYFHFSVIVNIIIIITTETLGNNSINSLLCKSMLSLH